MESHGGVGLSEVLRHLSPVLTQVYVNQGCIHDFFSEGGRKFCVQSA